MTQINATELEDQAMTWIARNLMTELNGAYPDNAGQTLCFLWADELAADLNITVNQAKGVLGSATAKGLIFVDQFDGDDETQTGLTEVGYELWSAAHPEEQA